MNLNDYNFNFQLSVKDFSLIFSEIVITFILFLFLYSIIHFSLKQFEKLIGTEKFQHESKTLRKFIRGILFIAFIISSLSIFIFNVYLLYIHTDLILYTKQYFTLIEPKLVKIIITGIIKSFILLLFSLFIIRSFKNALFYLKEKAKAWERITSNNESIEKFFITLHKIQRNSILLSVLLFTVKNLSIPTTVSTFIFVTLKVYLIISLGILLIEGIGAAIDSLDALSIKYSNDKPIINSYMELRALIPLFRRCAEYVTYIFVATCVILQISFISQFAIYGARIAKLIGIFFFCRVLIEVINLFVDRSLFPLEKASEIEIQKRKTLSPLTKSFLKYFIFFIGLILALKSLSINPGTVLAGAGILGIVVGFGAQPLVNDIVTGFFILFENLYLVGDFIETANARGIVEAIDIRTSRIRDPNGQLHILRNGQLNEVINYSKSYTYAIVEVGVSYDSNLDHVYKVLTEVGLKVKEININCILPTEIQGLEKFGDSELLIRTITKVKPGCHLQVARDIRKLIKEAFDKENIEIPFPRRVVYLKDINKNIILESQTTKL